jgi:hypothetical protein
MSEGCVEGMRRAVEAFNARDIDEVLTYFDPSIEFHSTFAVVGGGVYHGHEGMRSWHRDVQEVWGDEIRIEPEAFFDLGEQTLLFLVLHGRGQQSALEVAMPSTVVYTWRRDLVILAKHYADRDEALRDLGVSLDELEPDQSR